MKRILAMAAFVVTQRCAAVQAGPAQGLPVVDAYTAARRDGIFNCSRAVRAAGVSDISAGVASAGLLGTAYKADTLVGSATTPEQLVVDLRGLDCFTFIDNVEALRRAGNYPDYVQELEKVRYADGKVDFNHRHHFFTDWAQGPGARTRDITDELETVTRFSFKQLNAKADGTPFIQGLSAVKRAITYLPSVAITNETLSRLQ